MKYLFTKIFLAFMAITFASCQSQKNNQPLYQSDEYSVFSDSVVQKNFTAKARQNEFFGLALSDTEMVSDYKSPALHPHSATVTFKFSINGDDNEAPADTNHHIICPQKNCATPVISFGKSWSDSAEIPANAVLQDGTQLLFKADMRAVLNAFKQKGYYTTFNGKKIYKNDFKGVFVAGDVPPLTWDFANLANHHDLELKDNNGDGIYELKITLHPSLDTIASHWKLTTDISSFPSYSSGQILIDALYNMALEEMQKDIRPDNTFRAGAKWDGVWTRDISYSIILSLAILHPDIAQNSLMKKVKDGKIIQDTGTGGAYPVSTDRMIWATAAWEIYKVTGDKNWLKKSYNIIKKSADDDAQNCYDPLTGLVHGESSFLDWREQTYPTWMQPADIYESECLGTNAVHYEANNILSEMAQQLDDTAAANKYQQRANIIKTAINKYLWLPKKGYYGQYLYGNIFKILSPRSESLGEALCILFNIADAKKQKEIIQKTPVTTFGITCIFPQIPGIPPYHNNAVWPFVQAYWSLAAAKAGNEKALTKSMSAIYRAAALFLTNKENMVAENGDYLGTQINSDRQLWSVAGNLALIYKIIFGMDFKTDQLNFKPFVPKSFEGKHVLKNFKYRKAVLEIALTGYGNEIKSFTLDNKKLDSAIIPGNLSGKHIIKIVMADNKINDENINNVENYFSPEMPLVNDSANMLHWQKMDSALKYIVIKNGKVISTIQQNEAHVAASNYAEYQIIAADKSGYESFASKPVINIPANAQQIFQMEKFAAISHLPYKGFSGNGFVEISKTKSLNINIKISVPDSGLYSIDFRYANGNGPVNTDNKCAMRTLQVDSAFTATIIFPQRGKDQWSNWGYSNSILVELKKGAHQLSLSLLPVNENMNGIINQAMLDYMRIIKIK